MRMRWSSVVVGVALGSLLAASCGSSSSDDSASHAGSGGMGAIAGTGAHAGASSGGSSSGGKGGATASGGSAAMSGAGASSTAGAANGGDSNGAAGASNTSGASGADGSAGAPPSVVDATCVRDADCLAVCNANGWPAANCFGGEKRYCFCKSAGEPSCVNGTTAGCPAGMQCRGTTGCTPYGTATDGVPCNNGDECAVDYTCVTYGNPLPNGESTACRRWCQAGQPLPPDCYSCTTGLYCDPRPEGVAGAGG